jgi:hypothetical protein
MNDEDKGHNVVTLSSPSTIDAANRQSMPDANFPIG